MGTESENETLRREGYAPGNLAVGARGARTRQKIVEETLRLFEAKGFHATSVDAIAKAAGTSRSTLYQYFESKDQIFVELLDECGSALMRVVRRIGPLGPTRLGFDNLHWWLGEWAYVHDKYRTMFLQWATVDTPGTKVPSLVHGFNNAYYTRIARRLESSEVHGLDPVDAAIALTSVVNRFNYFRQMGLVPRLEPDELLDGLAVFIQLMLFPGTPPEVFDLVTPPPEASSRAGGTHPDEDELVNRLDGLRAADTVHALVDSGARLFAEHGYHGTTVDDVVGKTGLARGTFYKYFDGKLDLLLQLTRECVDEVRPRVERFAELDPVRDGPGPLRDWLRDWLPFHARYLGIMRAWLEGTAKDPRLLGAVRQVSREMQAAALAVLDRIERPHPLSKEVAVSILGATLERLPDAALRQGRSPRETVELMASTIERGLFNTGAAT